MDKTYRVAGMTCGGCASSVQRAIVQVLPEAQVSVDLESGKVTVSGGPEDAVIEQAVEGAGFTYGGAA